MTTKRCPHCGGSTIATRTDRGQIEYVCTEDCQGEEEDE